MTAPVIPAKDPANANETCSVVVLISGNGSNLQAIIDASANASYSVSAVISNKVEAYGLTRARDNDICATCIDHRAFDSREQFDAALIEEIDRHNPQIIVLAGFMRILSAGFVQHYGGKILNIHPSLLPKYTGTNTHQRAIDAGDKLHGVSVHFVTEELDGGPVIAQSSVPVLETDNADTLAARVTVEEHKLYPQVVQWAASKRLSIKAGVVYLDGKTRCPQA